MKSLSGLRVLVTRPQPQNDELSAMITERGGQAYSLPLIKIEPLAVVDLSPEVLSAYTFAIFVSRPAAQLGGRLVKGTEVDCYAVGESTAATLKESGIFADYAQNADSESLMQAIGDKPLKGHNVLIIKGEGGRTYLQDVLRQKGAVVDTLDLYRRVTHIYPENAMSNILMMHKVHAIVVTSGQILEGLLSQIDTHLFDKVVLVVPGRRVMKMAESRGIRHLICATGADNNAILSSLSELEISKL